MSKLVKIDYDCQDLTVEQINVEHTFNELPDTFLGMSNHEYRALVEKRKKEYQQAALEWPVYFGDSLSHDLDHYLSSWREVTIPPVDKFISYCANVLDVGMSYYTIRRSACQTLELVCRLLEIDKYKMFSLFSIAEQVPQYFEDRLILEFILKKHLRLQGDWDKLYTLTGFAKEWKSAVGFLDALAVALEQVKITFDHLIYCTRLERLGFGLTDQENEQIEKRIGSIKQKKKEWLTVVKKTPYLFSSLYQDMVDSFYDVEQFTVYDYMNMVLERGEHV